MKNYFKKFSIMFVMLLAIILGNSTNAWAASSITTDKNVYLPGEKYITATYSLGDKSQLQGMGFIAIFPSDIPHGQILSLNNISNYTRDSMGYIGFSYPNLKTQVIKAPTVEGTYDLRIYSDSADGAKELASSAVFKVSSNPSSSISSILLDKDKDSLQVGQIDKLTATTTPPGSEIVWTSSDESIATVDSTGKVTGIKVGKATITAQIKGSETKATCEVTVTEGTIDPPPVNPPTEPTGDGKLFIELVDGNIKQYDVDDAEISKFVKWYKDRDNDDSESPYYKFTKGSYKDYVVHDKIDWFEVR